MNTKTIGQRVLLSLLGPIIFTMHGRAQKNIAAEDEPALCNIQFTLPQNTADKGVKANTKSYNLSPNQIGAFGPVYNIESMQKLSVEMTYPKGKSGQRIIVEVLDGGLLGNKKIVQALSLNSLNKIVFNFQPGEDPGLYRISLRKDMDVKEVQFWVGAQPTR